MSAGSNLYKCTEQKVDDPFVVGLFRRSNLYKCTEQKRYPTVALYGSNGKQSVQVHRAEVSSLFRR